MRSFDVDHDQPTIGQGSLEVEHARLQRISKYYLVVARLSAANIGFQLGINAPISKNLLPALGLSVAPIIMNEVRSHYDNVAQGIDNRGDI